MRRGIRVTYANRHPRKPRPVWPGINDQFRDTTPEKNYNKSDVWEARDVRKFRPSHGLYPCNTRQGPLELERSGIRISREAIPLEKLPRLSFITRVNITKRG